MAQTCNIQFAQSTVNVTRARMKFCTPKRIKAITIRIPLNSNSINAIPSQIDHTVSKVNYCTTETFKKFSELSRNSNLSIFRCAVCLPLMHSRNCVTPYRPVSPPLNISTSCRGLTVSVKNTQLLIHYKS